MKAKIIAAYIQWVESTDPGALRRQLLGANAITIIMAGLAWWLW